MNETSVFFFMAFIKVCLSHGVKQNDQKQQNPSLVLVSILYLILLGFSAEKGLVVMWVVAIKVLAFTISFLFEEWPLPLVSFLLLSPVTLQLRKVSNHFNVIDFFE